MNVSQQTAEPELRNSPISLKGSCKEWEFFEGIKRQSRRDVGNGSAQENNFCDLWLNCLANHPESSIYLHPDLILAQRDCPDNFPLVSCLWEKEESRLQGLAVFARKEKDRGLFHRVSWAFSAVGLHLMADQVLTDDGAETLPALVRRLSQRISAGTENWVYFEDLDLASPLWNSLVEAEAKGDIALYYPFKPQPHWWIRFPEPAEEYWKKFSGKTRWNFRNHAKKLKHSLVCYSAPEEVPQFLEKANLVSKESWQSRRMGLRIKNGPKETHFWQSIASLGAFRSYVLEQEGRPLAFQLAMQWKGLFTFVETGFDPAYSSYSPGTVLFYRLLEDLIQRDPPHLCDFSFGDAEYKKLFGTHQILTGPVIMMHKNFRARLAIWLDQLHQGIRQTLRTGSKHLGIHGILRRIYRKN